MRSDVNAPVLREPQKVPPTFDTYRQHLFNLSPAVRSSLFAFAVCDRCGAEFTMREAQARDLTQEPCIVRRA